MKVGITPGAPVWRRIRAVIEKEWAEIIKNKMILWMMALIPVLLVGMILGTDFFIARAGAQGVDMDEDEMPIPDELEHLPGLDALIIQMNEQYMFYLLLIPASLPVYIAAHSIIGEKETKTLEPLLATPISTWELLFGKSVAATVPPILLTWLSFAILLVGLKLIAPPVVFTYGARGVWIVGMLLFSPLLAFLSVLVGVIVSSRINDPRAAQQIAGIFVIPLIGISLVVLAGLIFVDVPMVLYAAVGLLIVDMVVLYLAAKVFQRETILTRWK
jgi:ABC-2 type transport system permease protein